MKGRDRPLLALVDAAPLVAAGGFDPLDDGDGDGDGWMATLARRGKRARILRTSPTNALIRDSLGGRDVLVSTQLSNSRSDKFRSEETFPFCIFPQKCILYI